MGHLLRVNCGCGYENDRLASNGLFAGLAAVFTCPSCTELVTALYWGSGYAGGPVGDVLPRCPRCESTAIERWGDGDMPHGPCPKCGRDIVSESIGIAD